MNAISPEARRSDARQRKREHVRKRREEAKRLAAIEAERKAEEKAPAQQRNDVVRADGETYKHARLQAYGSTFVISNPITHLVRLYATRAKKADIEPLFKEKHEIAAAKLILAWSEGGEGIGLGASDFTREGGPGTSTPQGFSEAVLERLGYQNRQRAICAAAATYLGGMWPCVYKIAIKGITLTVWADLAGMHRNAAPGYAKAALDRLVEFWAEVEKRKDEDRPVRIRSVEVAGRG